MGDEIALHEAMAAVDFTNRPEMMGVMLRHLRQMHAERSPLYLASLIARFVFTGAQAVQESSVGHCEVAVRLDTALRAVADFADLKIPHTISHSMGVAALAADAGRQARLPESDVIAAAPGGLGA